VAYGGIFTVPQKWPVTCGFAASTAPSLTPGTALENRRAFGFRGFESRPLRHEATGERRTSSVVGSGDAGRQPRGRGSEGVRRVRV